MKNFYGFLVDRVGAVVAGSRLFSDAQIAAGMVGAPAIAPNGTLMGPDGAVLQAAVASAIAPIAAAPIDAIAATQTLTSNNTNVSNNNTVTVNGKVYTYKTALTPTEGQVLIGADADGSLTNLASAINHTGTPGTDYSCAAANPDASSGAVAAHALTFTARTAGASGNALTLAKTAATLTVGGATFAGGVDGTPGVLNQLGAFGGQPYYCTAAATVATAGAWKKLTLGSLS